MSLIQRITTRRFEDLINQGYRFDEVGSVAAVTAQNIIAAATERTIVVTGLMFTTTSATDVLVTIGFKNTTTNDIFKGYVRAGGPLIYTFPIGDERYSQPGDSLVITTDAAGPTVYTVYGRIVGEKVALGYIEHLGAPAHSGSPGFPPDHSGFSGLWRGGWPA